MTRIVCPFVKVNNLIVDLQVHNAKTYPCPLVAHSVKRKYGEPFLMPEALVRPGEFVIQNCVFRAGQNIETEKKFMRAGPRATQYFDPKTVRADIVCLGKVCPGINNIIRELVILLKETYRVESVTGIKFSFKGYYDSNMIDMTPQIVETIHHKGGSFLGVSRGPFHKERIIDSLIARGVNQLYLIGGNDTIRHAI
jgi:6-phosphofructokinase 1